MYLKNILLICFKMLLHIHDGFVYTWCMHVNPLLLLYENHIIVHFTFLSSFKLIMTKLKHFLFIQFKNTSFITLYVTLS